MELNSPSKTVKNKLLNLPFYAVPDNVKTSTEIINEARASVRPIDTKRPFTPRGGQRHLFENVIRRSRPPSAYTLDNLAYDATEPRIPTNARLHPIGTSIKSKDLQTNAELCVESLSSDGLLTDQQTNLIQGKTLLPSISLIPEEIQEQQPLNEAEIKSHLKRKLAAHVLTTASTSNTIPVIIRPVKDTEADEHKPEILESADATLDETYVKSRVFPLLKQLKCEKHTVSEEDDLELCATIKNLYNTLQEGNLLRRHSKYRCLILKTIFKIFSRKNGNLLLQASRLCLSMNISGNNFTSVSKVIFKIAQNDANDSLFLQDNILGVLLQTIYSMNPLQDTEGLIYSVGALKFLSINLTLLREVSSSKGIEIICHHMKTINDYKMTSNEISDQISHVLFQLTGCLRNLAEYSANRRVFIISGSITELSRILALFPKDCDIIMNVARTLSKLTMYYEICNTLTENQICFPAAVHLLDIYKDKKDFVIRLCFAFGNVAAKNDEARQLLFQQRKFEDVLMTLLEIHYDKNVEFPDRQRDLLNFTCKPKNDLDTDTNAFNDDDVIIKIIRLLANISVSSEVGHQIAENEKLIAFLLSVLGTKDLENHEELILSALAALSNLSYYSMENAVFMSILKELIMHLQRLLTTNIVDVLIETLRVLGNISRAEEARKCLADIKIVETAVSLLESDNKDIIYLSCGLLMNAMIDESYRVTMNKENGADKLIELLNNLGFIDWQLASIICQTIWNYTCVSVSTIGTKLLNSQNSFKLNNSLKKYLDKDICWPTVTAELHKPEKNIEHDIWQLEFCPVAKRLLDRINNLPE